MWESDHKTQVTRGGMRNHEESYNHFKVGVPQTKGYLKMGSLLTQIDMSI